MSTITNAISANLRALALTLQRSQAIAAEADEAMAAGKRNLAVGTLLDMEQLLPQAEALTDAIMALHRGDRG